MARLTGLTGFTGASQGLHRLAPRCAGGAALRCDAALCCCRCRCWSLCCAALRSATRRPQALPGPRPSPGPPQARPQACPVPPALACAALAWPPARVRRPQRALSVPPACPRPVVRPSCAAAHRIARRRPVAPVAPSPSARRSQRCCVAAPAPSSALQPLQPSSSAPPGCCRLRQSRYACRLAARARCCPIAPSQLLSLLSLRAFARRLFVHLIFSSLVRPARPRSLSLFLPLARYTHALSTFVSSSSSFPSPSSLRPSAALARRQRRRARSRRVWPPGLRNKARCVGRRISIRTPLNPQAGKDRKTRPNPRSALLLALRRRRFVPAILRTLEPQLRFSATAPVPSRLGRGLVAACEVLSLLPPPPRPVPHFSPFTFTFNLQLRGRRGSPTADFSAALLCLDRLLRSLVML